MPTPETVPFRLTRDMIAPMGICETGGVFKKACQSTLEVLRKNHSVIITILEVLLYDPLYIWNVVPTPAGSKGEFFDFYEFCYIVKWLNKSVSQMMKKI